MTHWAHDVRASLYHSVRMWDFPRAAGAFLSACLVFVSWPSGAFAVPHEAAGKPASARAAQPISIQRVRTPLELYLWLARNQVSGLKAAESLLAVSASLREGPVSAALDRGNVILTFAGGTERVILGDAASPLSQGVAQLMERLESAHLSDASSGIFRERRRCSASCSRLRNAAAMARDSASPLAAATSPARPRLSPSVDHRIREADAALIPAVIQEHSRIKREESAIGIVGAPY